MDSYNKQLRKLTRQFEKSHGKSAYTSKEAARWLIENGFWKAPDTIALQRCAEDLSSAWREDYVTDPQGRKVRVRHNFLISESGTQLRLWQTWEQLSPKQMALSFQGRRRQIVGECKQLKNDVDSYNENKNTDKEIIVSFNIGIDLKEAEAKKSKAFSASEQEPLVEQSLVGEKQKASGRVLSRPSSRPNVRPSRPSGSSKSH